MPVFTDQLDRAISIPSNPQRIISLVPSQTELLFDLGLGDRVVGITKFCIHPNEWFRSKTRVGGTKNIHLDRIRALQPDLIIANKEENTKEQVEALGKEYPVWISDIANLGQALDMILKVAEITRTSKDGIKITHAIQQGFEDLSTDAPLPAAYLIWKNPYITVGGDTFINDVLKYAGCSNIFIDRERYPAVSLDELKEQSPKLILLSSEPYPFKEKDLEELQLALPNSRIVLADGEYFSWYGSRLLGAPAYFKTLRAQLGVQ